MRVIGIGKLRRRVEIQEATDTRDNEGGNTRAWGTVARVWARVEPLTGQELFEAGQVVPRARVRVTLRGYADLTTASRFYCEQLGKTYEILHIGDVDERGAWMECLCVEAD